MADVFSKRFPKASLPPLVDGIQTLRERYALAYNSLWGVPDPEGGLAITVEILNLFFGQLMTLVKKHAIDLDVLSAVHPGLGREWVSGVLAKISDLPPGLGQTAIYTEVPVEAFGDDAGVGRGGILVYLTLKEFVAKSMVHYQLAGFNVDPCVPGADTYHVQFKLRPTGVQDLMEK